MKAEDFKQVTSLGAGMIGNTIALHFAKAGYQVPLYSRSQQTLDRAIDNIKANLSMFLEGQPNKEKEIETIIGRIKTTRSMEEAVAGSPIIIESVAEDLAIKQDVFKELDEICPKDVILGTNTSVISVTKIASKAKNRSRIVGTHFWFPAHIIPLVEVAKGQDTSDETMEIAYQFMKKAGKRPIKCLKDVPGFVANRLQHALAREAVSIVERGIADAATVDEAVRNSFGIRLPAMGPCMGADMAGLDLLLAIHRTDVLKDIEASPNPSPLLVEKVKKGELGMKTGKGFYDWTPEKIKSTRENYMKFLLDYVRRQQGQQT